MRKFLLLLCTLLGTVGAWATDVVISDRTNTVATGDVTTTNEHKYGTYSNAAGGTTFTTNAASGMAGVTVTADDAIIRAAYFSGENYKYVMGFNPSDANAHTITISAPEGYLVTGYSITAISTSSGRTFTVTPAGDTSKTATAPGTTAINKTGLNSQTATITIQAANANTGNFLCFPLFSVTVMSATANLVNVTYELYESDGTTLVNSVVKEQEENSAIDIPSSLNAPTYYDYATTGTIGSSDCTIKVTRTLKSGYVISLDGLSNSKCYNIRNNRGTWAVGSGATVVNSTNELNLAFLSTDTKQQFAFITYEGNVYLYSVGEGKFAYIDGTKLSLTADVTNAVAASPVTFVASTNATYKYSEPIIVTVNGYHFGISTGFSPDVYKYQSQGDGGNCAYIKEAGSFDATSALAALQEYFHPNATVKYAISDESGVIYTSPAFSTTVGASISSLPAELQRSYCTYNVSSETMVAGENIVNVTVTYDLPFDISADYASAKWYYLNLKSSNYPTYSSEGTPNVTLPSSRTLGDENALWAFIGNPYQGFSIVNKAAGSALVLGSASPNGDGNTGANTHATLGSGQAYERYFPVSSTFRTNGFFLQTSEGYALNLRSTANLAYWTGGKDAGSTFVVEEYVENYYSLVEAEVIPYLMDGENPSPTIGKPFGLSSTAATSIVTTYRTQLNNKQFTLAEYEAIVAAKNAGIIYPEAGKFYLVKNTYNGKYMRVTASGTHGTVFADLTAEEAAKDASAHFTFVENASHLYMSTQGEYLNWVYGRYDGYEGYTATNFDKYVHFANLAPGVGAFSIAYGNGEGDYAGYLGIGFYALKNTETKVVAGSPTDQTHEMAQWTFEEVSTLGITLNGPVDGKYYATLCVPFDITALDGATAYTLAKDGTTLNTTEISPIPAGTPVLLEGTSASATATIATAASTAISTSTALTGQYFASTFDGAANYTLGTDGTKVGFYHWDGTTLGANRAYVAGSTGGSVKGFAINWGDADGIQSVDNGQTMDNATIYNLAGQRMNKVQRGVNIVNGKKVIIK